MVAMMGQMIALFTDFGAAGPYVGQTKAVLAARAPGVAVIDLMHDASAYHPKRAAYLLAALVAGLPAGAVILGVVDPDVGHAARRPVVVEVGGRFLVGPDNGLFAPLANQAARRGQAARWWLITWRPETSSATFHGRDLFAPVAAMLAEGAPPPGEMLDPTRTIGADWPDDLSEIVYVDGYGNAMTGIRADSLPPDAVLNVRGQTIAGATTFSDVPVGAAMWYRNAFDLVEIAINRGQAAAVLDLRPGTEVQAVAAA